VQVLLAVEHTIFKIDDTVDNYKNFINFIIKNCNLKNIKENQFFIPRSLVHTESRKELMKRLYTFYKRNSKNFNENLKFELLKRIDKPIHIHFLSKGNIKVSISATFYEDHICQLLIDSKQKYLKEYILEYFGNTITHKNSIFHLYELKLLTIEDKYKIKVFLQKNEIAGVSVSMIFNIRALNSFLLSSDCIPIQMDLENACHLLQVSKSDSLEKVKKHYRKLAKVYHPDLSSLENNVSTEKFQSLSNAFDIIKKYKTAA